MATEIDITLKGIRPLQLNRMLDESKNSLSEKSSNVLAGQKPPVEEEAKSRGYFMDEEGKLPFIPHDMLFNCIIDAGRFLKAGRRQLTTGQSSQIPGLLVLKAPHIMIEKMDDKNTTKFVPAVWTHERFLPQNMAGQRVPVWRPVFYEWYLRFTLDVYDSEIHPDVVRQLIDKAGRFCGLGPMRPNRKGTYGMFIVDNWTVRKIK